MSEFPEDLFQQLYKRAPSDADRDRLIAVKSSLGLSSRDEMWPVIMTLDHYTATNQSARAASVKEVRSVLEALKSVPQQAGPIAAAEAKRAINGVVDAAAERISKIAVEKSKTRADRISKRQLIAASIAGALIACLIAAAASIATYLVIDARGMCAERPTELRDGSIVCYVEPASG